MRIIAIRIALPVMFSAPRKLLSLVILGLSITISLAVGAISPSLFPSLSPLAGLTTRWPGLPEVALGPYDFID